jgi:hypothetical protein
MFKGRAELVDGNGSVVAIFDETCHDYGATVVTVKLRGSLSPFKLQGTENLAIFAKAISQPVIFVEASDPAGTEINEFHGRSATGCVADNTEVTLIKSPGGDLSTLLIVLGKGTVHPRP